jgi:Flp pilus assembly protein TadG
MERFWAAVGRFSTFARDKSGQIAVIMALSAPVLIGALGVGAESTYWYLVQRDAQDAADAAVVAAATNTSSSYIAEGQAVTSAMGFTNGSSNVTVTVTNNATCPGIGGTCYEVTVSKIVPLQLAQLVGYRGDTTLGSSSAVVINASSYSLQGRAPRKYCLLTLSTTGTGILGNGVPQANFAGCNLMSDSGARCNGHNTGADYVDAVGTDNGCGVIGNSNQPSVPDPYKWLAQTGCGGSSCIPTNPCSSYPQESGGTVATWSGNKDLSTSTITTGATTTVTSTTIGSPAMPITFICGDLKLTGNTTITSAAGGSLLVIENGQLDTNGYTLATANGSQLTTVFSGTAGSYTHYPTGGGTLNLQAPYSGSWHGVALYQDPALTTGVDISSAGNAPTWDITGLVYTPNANITFNGAVNKSSNGASCFVIVANTMYVSGTGAIWEHGGCDAAGLSMPTSPVAIRGKLVG